MTTNRFVNRSELIGILVLAVVGILMLRPQGLFALKVRK